MHEQQCTSVVIPYRYAISAAKAKREVEQQQPDTLVSLEGRSAPSGDLSSQQPRAAAAAAGGADASSPQPRTAAVATAHAGGAAAVLSSQLLEADLQIIGMSATLPNVDVVAAWLGAAYYWTDFRPVKLDHWLKVGMHIKDANEQV